MESFLEGLKTFKNTLKNSFPQFFGLDNFWPGNLIYCIPLFGFSDADFNWESLFPPHPNTSLYAAASPILATCCLCFACGKGFVSTSAVCCWDLQLSTIILPSRTCSLIEWNCTSMCFAHLWNCRFFVIAIDPSLSLKIMVGNLCVNLSSLNRFCNQRASCAASDKAIYSASVDKSAVTDCFFEY